MQFTAEQQALLDEVHYAVIGTLNSDGTIQQTVVWFLREPDNDLRFSTGAHSVKVRNLRRNPTITLTVEAGRRYISVSGEAVVEPADEDLRYRLAVRYLGADKASEWVTRRPDAERVSVRMRGRRVHGQGV